MMTFAEPDIPTWPFNEALVPEHPTIVLFEPTMGGSSPNSDSEDAANPEPCLYACGLRLEDLGQAGGTVRRPIQQTPMGWSGEHPQRDRISILLAGSR